VKKHVNIVILTEGKPGHISQSKGIAELIDAEKSVQIIYVTLIRSAEEAMLRGLTGIHELYKVPSVKSLYNRAKRYIKPEDLEHLEKNPPDLVIAVGTILSSFCIVFKKYFKCKNIISMRPNLLPLASFDLVLLPKHDEKGDEGKNVLIASTSPNMCFTQSLMSEGEKFASGKGIERQSDLWALFLGGPSKVKEFPSDKVIAMTRSILDKAKEKNAKLLVSTSRRTTPEFETALSKLVEDYISQVVYLQIYSKEPVSTTMPILALSKKVFVTEDSVSMVSEALWAKRQSAVIELPSVGGNDENKITKFKSILINKGLLSSIKNTDDLDRFISKSDTDWSAFDDIEQLKKAVNGILGDKV
jgi:mitochondrial fission protein ELM1